MTVTSGTVSDNLGTSGGGGINNHGTLTVTDSELSGNSTEGDGGAIRNKNGTVTATSSTFLGNSASWGGGIWNNGAATVTNSSFSANSAVYGGGALNYCTLAVSDSRFLGNSADWGGGINNQDTLTVTNSVLSGNSASSSGGGINSDGVVTVANSTLAGNSATGEGGGIRNCYHVVTLHNSIIADNTASSEPDVHLLFGSTLGGSHNLIGNGTGQTGFIHGTDGNLVGTALNPIDPLFVINPSNGGDGWGDNPDTPGIDESANDNYGDLRLWDESPAVDAGDNALLPADTFDLDGDGNVTEPLPLDLAGDPRVQDGDNDQTATVNMGAYETTAGAMPDRLTLYVDADVSVPGDGLSWSTALLDLQEALSEAAARNTDTDPANDIDQIWIAEGIYMPSAELEPGDARSAAFSLLDGVAMYGGFAGTETIIEERDISAHVTTLSGNWARSTIFRIMPSLSFTAV